MTHRKNIAWTLFAVAAMAIALTGFADDASDTYSDAAFKRGLVTFAVARALNGVISVAQGTEVAVEPGGVGVNLSVGQILDPINDLIEQFSTVMLVATSSLGLQNILLDMTGWWGITALLVAAGLALIAATWWSGGARPGVSTLAAKIFLVAVFLRFALPLLVVGTHIVFAAFLEEEHDTATAVLETTSSQIEEINESELPAADDDSDSSLLERLGGMLENTVQQLDVSGRIERLKTSASNASEQIIRLIVIFVLQTIILPLVFLWLFVEGLKGIASRTTRI